MREPAQEFTYPWRPQRAPFYTMPDTMTTTMRARSSRWILGGLGAASLGLALGACDMGSLGSAAPADVAGAAAKCPNLATVKAAGQVDWASEFELDAKAAAQIKGGVEAALELRDFAKKLDADLKLACGGLAKDLGGGNKFANGKEACDAAVKAMANAKAKIGGNLKLKLAVSPPVCAVDVKAMTDCVAKCDVNVQPGKVEAKCEGGELVGKCSGQCSGSCEVDAGAKCEGTCKGECTANFSGKCGGECNGKCDGSTIEGGSCAGKCEGSCSAAANGSCGGSCKGTCELKAQASCSGQCKGSCSVDFEAPRCTGEVKPPKASAECQARCDADVSAEVKCTRPRVALVIEGAANKKLALEYKAAIEKNIPLLIEISMGMKDRAVNVAGQVDAVVKGAQTAVKAAGKASGSAGARLTACVAAPFKAAIDAAASVKANVNVSVSVQASVSAKGSASGSAGGSAG